jgi:NADH-quinone oxidoreductase subunit M
MLWMYQRVFLGQVTSPENARMSDIGLREKLVLVPILLMMVWIGVYSAPFVRRMDASLEVVRQRILHAPSPDGGFRVDHRSARPAENRDKANGR